MILRHPKSDFTYSLMILLGNIVEHLNDNSIISTDSSNRVFYVAEEALVHSLLTVVTDASCIDLKIEALKQYIRYLSKLLVDLNDPATHKEQLRPPSHKLDKPNSVHFVWRNHRGRP